MRERSFLPLLGVGTGVRVPDPEESSKALGSGTRDSPGGSLESGYGRSDSARQALPHAMAGHPPDQEGKEGPLALAISVKGPVLPKEEESGTAQRLKEAQEAGRIARTKVQAKEATAAPGFPKRQQD